MVECLWSLVGKEFLRGRHKLVTASKFKATMPIPDLEA